MNCGHGWHAFPPLVLGAPGQTPQTSPGWQQTSEQPDFGAEPAAAPTPSLSADDSPQIHGDSSRGWARQPSNATGASEAAQHENRSRSEQLAEIREMLAEVQSEQPAVSMSASHEPIDDMAGSRYDEPDAPATREESQALFDQHESTVNRAQPAPDAPPIEEQPDDSIDPLRQRLGMKGEKKEQPKPTDVRRLRRRHEKRERKRRHAKAAGSGAFLTGFLLVAMVVAGMIALYMLSPQIVERFPGSESAMTQYVETIDGIRLSVAETFDGVKGWVAERSEKG